MTEAEKHRHQIDYFSETFRTIASIYELNLYFGLRDARRKTWDDSVRAFGSYRAPDFMINGHTEPEI